MDRIKTAKRIYFWAGIYGLAVLAPGFFMESRVGVDLPPAITHPEYYYGFLSVGIAFQVLFLILSTDPVRYRPIMPACLVEKFGFWLAVCVLFAMGRVPLPVFAIAQTDLTLGILFAWAYYLTPREH